MLKEWAEDIKIKTKDMTKDQKVEYVLMYYWYHILLGVLLAGLIVLLIYHIGWGKKEMDFSLVIVNQEVDYARDQSISEEFASYSGIRSKKIQTDSDYLISYDNVELDGVNESSYEKFFFNWSAETIDAIIMPESFLRYCKKQGGELADLEEWMDKTMLKSLDTSVYKSGEKCEGIYVEDTRLAQKLECNQEDRLVLVFPKEMKHKEACRKFLEYLFDE
ncbi:MAG: hypothetical protein ACI4S0_03380 [Dorea sp.]